MGTEQFCLKWNNHHSNMLTVFEQLLSNEALVDVTLACEGLSMKAHKMVLSACSPFFQNLFLENPCKHPIVILKDMKYRDLKAIVDFMYRGEVNVSEDQLTALLKTAETLKVKGLAEVMYENKQESSIQDENTKQTTRSQVVSCGNRHKENRTQPISTVRRKHGRSRRHSLSDSTHSDSDSHVPTKLKEIDSTQVIEDSTMESINENDTQQRQSMKFTSHKLDVNSQSLIHCNSFKLQTYTMLPSINNKENASVEETKSGDEAEFDVEPSKLMEQTLTTDNVPLFSNSHPQTSQSASSQVNSVDNRPSGNVLDTQMCHISSNNGDNSALVPVSLAIDTPTSNNEFAQESIPDVKPGNLVPFEDSQLSPVPGPSHHKDKNTSVVSYLDTSVIPAIPGPSNYHSENSQLSLPQHHNQDCISTCMKKKASSFHNFHTNLTKINEKRPKSSQSEIGQKPHCPICLKSFFDASNLRRHMEIHYYQRKNYICHICTRRFSWKTHLMTHIRTSHTITDTPPSDSLY